MSKYIYFNINSDIINLELNICIHSLKCQSSNCDNCIILENTNYIKNLYYTLDNKLNGIIL